MPLPPMDSPDVATWDSEATSPQMSAPPAPPPPPPPPGAPAPHGSGAPLNARFTRNSAAPVPYRSESQQQYAPPAPQPPPLRPRIDRLTTIKGVLHSEGLATEAAWQMQALLRMGWEGEEGDVGQVRDQLEKAVRELHEASRRLSAISFWMHSQKGDSL